MIHFLRLCLPYTSSKKCLWPLYDPCCVIVTCDLCCCSSVWTCLVLAVTVMTWLICVTVPYGLALCWSDCNDWFVLLKFCMDSLCVGVTNDWFVLLQFCMDSLCVGVTVMTDLCCCSSVWTHFVLEWLMTDLCCCSSVWTHFVLQSL